MKKFIVGLICGTILSTIIVSSASGIWENIDVLRNDITVYVDGQEITEDNFVYNDTTYLPMRAIGEALGKDVQYNENTNTAVIKDKGETNLTNNNENRDDEYYTTFNGEDKYSIDGIRAFYMDLSSVRPGDKGWAITNEFDIYDKYKGDYFITKRNGKHCIIRQSSEEIIFEDYPTVNYSMSLKWYDTVFQPWLAANCTVVK